MNCRCFIFTRDKDEILLDVPEDWLLDDQNAESLAIHLSYEGEYRIFYLPIMIILDPDDTRVNKK